MQGSNYLVLCALYKVHRILSSRDERSQQEPNKKNDNDDEHMHNKPNCTA